MLWPPTLPTPTGYRTWRLLSLALVSFVLGVQAVVHRGPNSFLQVLVEGFRLRIWNPGCEPRSLCRAQQDQCTVSVSIPHFFREPLKVNPLPNQSAWRPKCQTLESGIFLVARPPQEECDVCSLVLAKYKARQAEASLCTSRPCQSMYASLVKVCKLLYEPLNLLESSEHRPKDMFRVRTWKRD